MNYIKFLVIMTLAVVIAVFGNSARAADVVGTTLEADGYKFELSSKGGTVHNPDGSTVVCIAAYEEAGDDIIGRYSETTAFKCGDSYITNMTMIITPNELFKSYNITWDDTEENSAFHTFDWVISHEGVVKSATGGHGKTFTDAVSEMLHKNSKKQKEINNLYSLLD